MGRGRKRYTHSSSVGSDGRAVTKRRRRTSGGWMSSMGVDDVMKYFQTASSGRKGRETGRNRELDPVMRNGNEKDMQQDPAFPLEPEVSLPHEEMEGNQPNDEEVDEEQLPNSGQEEPFIVQSDIGLEGQLQSSALYECTSDTSIVGDEEIPMPDRADDERGDSVLAGGADLEECGDHDDTVGRAGSVADQREVNPSVGMVPHRRPNFRILLRARSRMCHWTRILALITVCGSVRFTVKQYMFIRSVLHWISGDISLPSYSAVQRTLFPKALQFLFPRSDIVWVAMSRRRGMQAISEISNTASGEAGRVQCPLRIVNPSSWAKMDVMTFPFFEDMFGAEGKRLCRTTSAIADQSRYDEGAIRLSNTTVDTDSEMDCSVERSQVVMDRSAVTDPTRVVYVKDRDRRKRATTGDRLVLRVGDIPTHLQDIRSRKGQYGFRRAGSGDLLFYGTVRKVWCVGHHGVPFSSGVEAVEEAPQREKDLIKSLTTARPVMQPERRNRRNPRSATHTFGTNTQDEKRVIPGDICVAFCQNGEEERLQYVPVLVMRFWKNKDGIPSERLLWYSVSGSIRNENRGLSGSTCIANSRAHVCYDDIPAAAKQSVLESPRVCEMRRGRESSSGQGNIGKLSDGTRYVVYRVLLYCDDFRPFSTLYPQGSAGGCYLLPLGISPSKRNCRSAVHILSLTPPGVSTNEVLFAIIPDIIKATTEGIDGFLPNGMPVKIFIDVVGFIGDYPAAAHTIDVIGHIANAPCTLCAFVRLKSSEGSECGYTTEIHASSSAWIRCADRHSALRSSAIPDADANRLGMKTCQDAADYPSPLIELQEELKKVRANIPLTEEGKPVVSGNFDAYRSNFVAPDHLLTGLAKNVIELCLELLGNNETRHEMDVRLCDSLRANGLIRQNTILNSKGALNSMSLSSTYCLLLVAGPVFRRFWGIPRSSDCERAVELLDVLQELVGLTYWWPTLEVDGTEAVRYVRGKGMEQYLGDLQVISKLYVKKVDDFCRANGNVGRFLDKPNLHRLIELYEHSVPAFGHVRHFMELVFECAHQPLKRCIARSNHRNAHVSAVEHCIGNDWQGRVALLQSLTSLKSNDNGTTQLALRGLRHLLLGEEADLLQGNVEMDAKFIRETNECIHNSFVDPVKVELAEEGKINPAWIDGQKRWMARNQMKIPETVEEGRSAEDEMFSVKEVLNRSEFILESTVPLFRNAEGKDVSFFSCARRIRERKAFMQSSSAYGHDVINTGSVVQALVAREELSNLIITTQDCGSARKVHFAVLGILMRGKEGPWAAVVRCRTFSSGTLQVPPDTSINAVQLLKLGNGVRRVGLYHECVSDECKVVGRCVKHSKSLLSGGMYYFQGRRNGYPPRMA